MNIAVRLLWTSGVPRTAIEEARHTGWKLFAYRDAGAAYGLEGIDYTVLRRRGESGLLTPLFAYVTSQYASNRGRDATVDLDLIIKAARIIKGFTLFHDQFAGITGYLRKALYGEEYAVYIHETSLRSWGIKSFFPKESERRVLSGARVIITNTHWNKRTLWEHGYAAEVVYPGVYVASSVGGKRERIVLSVSTWDAWRRPWVYGEMARRIRGKLIMAGSWAVQEEMLEFKKRYGDSVLVTGRITDEELWGLYSRASAFVRFGYDERGPGMGVLEALAHGVPVVVNDGLGSKELVRQGENGYVVKDWEEAADRINALLDDPYGMSREALETAKSLSWENHARRLKELLEDGKERARAR
jgi:glycosyltransferase involved in cell wall biosynthesis